MYWLLLNMYSENFGFGPGGFFTIRVTFSNRMNRFWVGRGRRHELGDDPC